MKKIISTLCLSTAIAIQMSPAGSVLAAGTGLIPEGKVDANLNKDRFNTNDLTTTLNQVANYVVGILIVVAIFYILWAAYDFVTSSGSEEKVNGARRKIMYAAIGVIVALLAKGIVALVIGAGGAK